MKVCHDMCQIIPVYVHIDKHAYKCALCADKHSYLVDLVKIGIFFILNGIPPNLSKNKIQLGRISESLSTFVSSVSVQKYAGNKFISKFKCCSILLAVLYHLGLVNFTVLLCESDSRNIKHDTELLKT